MTDEEKSKSESEALEHSHVRHDDEIEIKGPGGTSARIRGTDKISAIAFLFGVLIAYFLWMHMEDTRIASNELSKAMSQLAEAQREMACIISLPMEDRLRQLGDPNSICKRLAKQGY